jgi:ubiquinone/menaquinone biosynthesis C-methylase UbiE
MSTKHVTPKEFWEDKIIGWEKGRYIEQTDGGLLERMANRSSSSLRFRLEASQEILRPFVANKRIVEIGCGSGQLAQSFMSMGAKNYLGYDIAENAIKQARENIRDEGVTFKVASVHYLPVLDTDIVFSLGLLDWLDDAGLKFLFKVSGRADYFHSISEKRTSLFQMLHRFYVFVAYGHRTGAYIPRYYSTSQLEDMIHTHNPNQLQVHRDPRLSFGAFVTSLPINS